MTVTPASDIRQLAPDDTALMASMMTMFGEVFDEMDTYTATRPGAEYHRRLLARDNFVALAALEGERVVGGLAAYVMHKFERDRSEFYLYDLAVVASHRRRGIATALILELRRIAAERGAYVIIVQADKGDEIPIALYSKLGTREEVEHFDIPVPS
jgi:aminoglycoside 3-N-acetyltransferase I